MQIILYLSVALIAVAFAILVFYIIQTLKSVKVTLDTVSKTIDDLEEQVEGITKETTELLQKTNLLADDIQQKSESLNSVVASAKNIGTTVDKFNKSLQSVSENVTSKITSNESKIAQIAQAGMIIFEFKDKFQNRKAAKKANKEQLDQLV